LEERLGLDAHLLRGSLKRETERHEVEGVKPVAKTNI